MDLAEDFVRYLASQVCSCDEELTFFEKFYKSDARKLLAVLPGEPFERLEYTRAIEILEQKGKDFEYPVSWEAGLQTEHERFLAEEIFKNL